ncbi:hypothetical protein GCK72_004052 [Caenorhabditis remanei]|uniref:Uncharacterized protein n=1 Tax=Caenorhabditis remanei TaxID=31234 RepID=A0A6A5HB72_CAERE|nr:hypothetical protein GCK72_004052 [Caenorhabditis remanei]KAF1764106.1 hypothetical protein GCK72_004052 [Caenorhabditis remanei]
MAPRPIPHSILSFSANLIPATRPHPIQKAPLETSAEKVAKYSKILKHSNCRHTVSHALLRLAQLNCPMRVFEKCQTEKRLQRFEGNVECLYQINILKRKFKESRHKEESEKFGKKAAKLELKEEEYDPEFSGFNELKTTIMEMYAEYKPTPIIRKFNR